MTVEVRGVLLAYFETGLEGTMWAMQEEGVEGYDGLHFLEPGDQIEIFAPGGKLIFQGSIDPDREAGKRTRPFTSYEQPSALGLWIHWTQRGWVPDDWATLFCSEEHIGVLKKSG